MDLTNKLKNLYRTIPEPQDRGPRPINTPTTKSQERSVWTSLAVTNPASPSLLVGEHSTRRSWSAPLRYTERMRGKFKNSEAAEEVVMD